jgi:hypothetical protein
MFFSANVTRRMAAQRPVVCLATALALSVFLGATNAPAQGVYREM